MNHDASERAGRAKRIRVAGLAGVLLLAGCSGVGTPPMQPLTAGRLEAAERRWEAHGAEAYRIVVRVRAPRFDPAVYDVVVAGGKLARVERNGEGLGAEDAGRHDFSVSGLFELMRGDLYLTGVPVIGDTPPIDLRAQFEDETGRLIRYRRTVGSGRRRVLLVEVVEYEPLGGEAPQT